MTYLSRSPVHITTANGIDLPIVEAGKVDGAWTVSDTAANHVLASALPGQKGNSIIYGHNLDSLFGPIQFLKGGEEIDIRMSDGTTKRYQVAQTYVVDPNQTALLAPTTTETLTLYTCTGFFDSQRFVVRAIPIR